jgi:peptidoglycan/xylan/chitin deacetylase (PgdA/CDA1 family)
VARNKAGEPLPRRACAITFDDGWRDNFEYALPILQQEQVPATVFAVADMVGTSRQFWPNRLQRLLAMPGPDRASRLPWLPELNTLASLPPDQPLDRETVAKLVAGSKRFSDEFLDQQLDEAERTLGLPAEQPALMDWAELRTMQGSGLVDVGSHTCNHRRLMADLSPAVMHHEIVDSQRLLSEQLQRPVTLFCYPNGDVSPAAASLVNRHYQAAVTTRHGINGRAAVASDLARLGIHEDIGATPLRFSARLSGWL